MGDSAGLEILAFARERTPATRTILLTAYRSEEVERSARDRGASAILGKPQPLPDLAQVAVSLIDARPVDRER